MILAQDGEFGIDTKSARAKIAIAALVKIRKDFEKGRGSSQDGDALKPGRPPTGAAFSVLGIAYSLTIIVVPPPP
jgi:hypothetical protein